MTVDGGTVVVGVVKSRRVLVSSWRSWEVDGVRGVCMDKIKIHYMQVSKRKLEKDSYHLTSLMALRVS